MRWLKWFAAGALAVPLGHQVVLLAMHAAGMIPMAPYSFAATKPFGVPALISLSFWGGVWGVILGALLTRMRGAAYWITAIIVGAIAPTLVAGLVVAPLKGSKMPITATVIAAGLIINAVWGLVTAALARLFLGRNRGIL
jgi:hypothetical protein